MLRGVRVVAVLVVLAVVAGYAAAAVRWEWRWEHESRTGWGAAGWTPNSDHRPPLTWLVIGQGCMEASHRPCLPYVFGMFSVPFPWDAVDPRFVWMPAAQTYSTPDGGGAWVRLPLWLLLIPAAPIAGHALVAGIRALRAVPGACARCGYDRAGLPEGAVCPECGATPRP